MAIAFTRAPTVAVGEAITSTQLKTLAAAFNDRITSGLGDGAWRIFFYWFGLFRQLRNPDDSGFAWPSLGEFFEVYQHLDATEAEYPLSPAGQAEGANLANPINAFVFGALGFGLDDEATRLAELPWDVAEPSDAVAWQLAQSQRGAWDPVTGGMSCPMFTAARAHWRIRYNRVSPYGNSYGGYAPSPEVGSDCADPGETNWLFSFTNLDDGSTQTYSGSCSENATDVAGIVTLPWAYYVVLNDGTVDILRANEWVEGPYVGEGRLQKQDAQIMTRVLNKFASEFRGSTEQRRSNTYHLQHAFDFQQFANSQYRLAPAVGQESNGLIGAIYPSVSLTSNGAAGDFMGWNLGGNSHAWAAGSVWVGSLVEQSNLAASVILELLDGEDVVETWTIEPDGTNTSVIRWRTTMITPNPLRVRLASLLQFKSGGGSLKIEFLELMDYKPNIDDYAVYLRVATASSGTPDGIGTDETISETISQSYWRKGCLWNINGKGAIDPKFDAVNRNAIFDSARRFSRHVRVIRRQEMNMPTAYAVKNGKSVLYFRRKPQGIPGTIPADAWAGIGPSGERVPSGEIKEGLEYIAPTLSGARYNGQSYIQGGKFTGVAGVTTYEGDAFEYNGIRRTAPPNGYSNRWVLWPEFKPFHPSDSSLFKPEAWADYYTLQNRCHLDALDIGGSRRVLNHVAFGLASAGRVRTPESPPGYNYLDINPSFSGFTNANGISCPPLDTVCEDARRAFYKSCRVYEPPLEIESVIHEEREGNDEVLRVTLTGRLHHDDSLSADISQVSSGWNIGDIQAQTYRTAENAIQEYILYQTQGTAPSWKIGDQAYNGALQTLPDNPLATIFPSFFLCQLIPEPYDDGNDSQNPKDTHFEHDPFPQMELYLRAMCEGFVDGETSASYACTEGTISLFDHTFESMCLQATGNRWLNTFEWEEIQDNRMGGGPLPNTEAKASIFNQFSNCINLLDTVRVMLPCALEKNVQQATVLTYVTAYGPDGNVVPCDGTSAVWADNTAPIPTPIMDPPTWVPFGGGDTPRTDSNLTGNCSGSLWEQDTTAVAVQFRYALADGDLRYAIPEAWRVQFEVTPSMLVTIHKIHTVLTRGYTSDIGEAEDCDGTKWPLTDGRFLKWDQTVLQDETICMVTGQTFQAPVLSRSDVYWNSSGFVDCPGGPDFLDEISVYSTATASLTIPLVP